MAPRYIVVTVIVVVVLLSGVAGGYFISDLSSTTSTSSISITSTSTVTTTCRTLADTNGSLVGSVEYPAEEFQFLAAAMNGAVVTGSTSQIDSLYNSLFTQSLYFGSATHLSFNFQFVKNPYFEKDMYGGDFNNPVLSYPTQVDIGTQGDLLLISVQIMNLYGSPYGNITSRGSNQLTIFMHSGNWTYGFGEENNMLPGTPLNESWAVLNGTRVTTTEGYYVHAFQSFLTPNQTYWIGPYSTQYNGGNGTYNAQNTYNNTGFFWAGSVILGTYTQPIMTRYIFAINITRLLALSSIPTSNYSTCSSMKILNFQTMFSLFTNAPYGTPVDNGAFTELHNLNDNFPGHDLYGPLKLSEYMTIEAVIPDTSYFINM